MRVRPRALVWLLPLTAGDYALWDWSVGGSHDVLALASGMTLLPLAAVSVGLLALAAITLLARLLRESPTMARSTMARATMAHPASPADGSAHPAEDSARERRKLAA